MVGSPDKTKRHKEFHTMRSLYSLSEDVMASMLSFLYVDEICRTSAISREFLKATRRALQRLTCTTVQDDHHPRETLRTIVSCPNLRYIEMDSERDENVQEITAIFNSCPKLEDLAGEILPGVLKSVHTTLPSLRILSQLVSDDSDIDSVWQKCTNVEILSLEVLFPQDEPPEELPVVPVSRMQPVLHMCTQIHTLMLKNLHADALSDTFELLEPLPLHSLAIRACGLVDFDVVTLCRTAPGLKRLVLRRNNITKLAVNTIAHKLPEIEELDIDEPFIEQEVIDILGDDDHFLHLRAVAVPLAFHDQAVDVLNHKQLQVMSRLSLMAWFK